MSRLFALDHQASTDDWYTPAWVFEGLGLEFDLDVASPPGGVDWVPAAAWYSESDDGLLQPWFGLVWCNPPYSRPGPWCRRWAVHPEGLLLVPSDLSSSHFFVAVESSDAIYVPRGRMRFVGVGGGVSANTGKSGSTVLLGRGVRAVAGMERLAGVAGGCVRRLVR